MLETNDNTIIAEQIMKKYLLNTENDIVDIAKIYM